MVIISYIIALKENKKIMIDNDNIFCIVEIIFLETLSFI